MATGRRDDDDGGPLDGVVRGWGKRLAATARVAGQAARLAVKRTDRDGAIGDALARELDQMKGMAMKLGQILSYFDGALPAETHAALQRLQRGAAPVKREVMLQVIADAFGLAVDALPGALFDRFEPEPVASASIGQVYRAHCLGREVAVRCSIRGCARPWSRMWAGCGPVADRVAGHRGRRAQHRGRAGRAHGQRV